MARRSSRRTKQKGGGETKKIKFRSKKIEKEFNTIMPELKKCEKECKKKQKTHKKECLKEYKDYIKEQNRSKYWKKMKLHVSDKKAEQMFPEGYVGACSTKCLKDKGFLGETKKQRGGRKRTLKNLTPEELEYFKQFPNLTTVAKKRLLKDPCWPSTETPECVKLMVKDNPWMLEEGGDKYAHGVVGKKSLLNKEIKKKKQKQTKKSGTKKESNKESKKESIKIKYNKYSKCLEKCELKEKNKQHVCNHKCKKYKKYETIQTKKNNSSEIIKKQIQTGGVLCLPCIPPILSGLGVMGAGAVATGAAATGAIMTRSKMSQSGNNFERDQSFEKNISKTHKEGSSRKGKIEKHKFRIKQKNNVVTYKENNGKLKKKVFKGKNMKDTIKKATKFYNNKIKYCVTRGYKKC